MISGISNRQARKSRIPCLNSCESCFPGRCILISSESHFCQGILHFLKSHFLHCILFKSQIPNIPFQAQNKTMLCDFNGFFNYLTHFHVVSIIIEYTYQCLYCVLVGIYVYATGQNYFQVEIF